MTKKQTQEIGAVESLEDAIGFLEWFCDTEVRRVGKVWNVLSLTSEFQAFINTSTGLIEFAKEHQDRLLMEGGELTW